jgi:hypothetical protein
MDMYCDEARGKTCGRRVEERRRVMKMSVEGLRGRGQPKKRWFN